MGKYYVSLAVNTKKYQVCREDIRKVYSHKLKKIPRLPAFAKNDKDADELTNFEDS
jgi:hypothetical protein